jgi:hypothetical protein
VSHLQAPLRAAVVTVLLINHPRANNANVVQDVLLRWVHGR